jgi:hypothetical protein
VSDIFPTPLNDEDYEDCYREAVCIIEKRFGVGAQFTLHHGKRRCILRDCVFEDFLILIIAWGIATADQIEAQRAAYLRLRGSAASGPIQVALQTTAGSIESGYFQ